MLATRLVCCPIPLQFHVSMTALFSLVFYSLDRIVPPTCPPACPGARRDCASVQREADAIRTELSEKIAELSALAVKGESLAAGSMIDIYCVRVSSYCFVVS